MIRLNDTEGVIAKLRDAVDDNFIYHPNSYGGYEYIILTLLLEFYDEIEWMICESQMRSDEQENDDQFSVAEFHKAFRQIPVTENGGVDKVLWIAIGESEKFRKILYNARMGIQNSAD